MEEVKKRIEAYKSGSTPEIEAKIEKLRDDIIAMLDEHGLKDANGQARVAEGQGQLVESEYQAQVDAMRKELRELAATRQSEMSQKGKDVMPVLEELDKIEDSKIDTEVVSKLESTKKKLSEVRHNDIRRQLLDNRKRQSEIRARRDEINSLIAGLEPGREAERLSELLEERENLDAEFGQLNLREQQWMAIDPTRGMSDDELAAAMKDKPETDLAVIEFNRRKAQIREEARLGNIIDELSSLQKEREESKEIKPEKTTESTGKSEKPQTPEKTETERPEKIDTPETESEPVQKDETEKSDLEKRVEALEKKVAELEKIIAADKDANIVNAELIKERDALKAEIEKLTKKKPEPEKTEEKPEEKTEGKDDGENKDDPKKDDEKDSEEDKEDEVQAGFKIGPLKRFFLKIVQFLKGRCKEGGRVHNLFSKAEGALIGSGAKVALSAAEKEAEKVDEKESEKPEKAEEKIDEEKIIEEIAIDGMEWIKENDERIFSTDHQWYMDLYQKTYTDFLSEFGDGKKPAKEGINKAVEMADELELPKTSENSGKLGRVNDLLFFRVTKGVIEKAKSVKGISLTEKDGKAKSFGDIWEAYNKYDLDKRLANEGKKAAEAARAAKGKSKETPEAETSDKGETR